MDPEDGFSSDEDNGCDYFWRPDVWYPTTLGNDDAAIILSTPKLDYYPGALPYLYDDPDGRRYEQPSDEAIDGLDVSFGQMRYLIRGKWYSTLEYNNFPFDKQVTEPTAHCASCASGSCEAVHHMLRELRAHRLKRTPCAVLDRNSTSPSSFAI